jgi:hypothetical protein
MQPQATAVLAEAGEALKRDHSIATVEDDYRKLYFDQRLRLLLIPIFQLLEPWRTVPRREPAAANDERTLNLRQATLPARTFFINS